MSSAPAADDADTRIGLPYFADNEAVELDAEVCSPRTLTPGHAIEAAPS